MSCQVHSQTLTQTFPHFRSPHLRSPHLTSPYLALPCLALPCLALPCLALPCLALPCTANLCTDIPDLRGFDSSRILISRVGIFTSMGNFPEILRQRISAGMILVGRLGVSKPGLAFGSRQVPTAAGRTRPLRLGVSRKIRLRTEVTFGRGDLGVCPLGVFIWAHE